MFGNAVLEFKRGLTWSCKVGSYLCKTEHLNHEKRWNLPSREYTFKSQGQGHDLLKPLSSEDGKRKQRGRTLTENQECVKEFPSTDF